MRATYRVDAASPIGMTKETAAGLLAGNANVRPNMVQGITDLFFFQYITERFSDWFFQICLEAAGWSTAAIIKMLRDENVYDDLPKIFVPTLIIHGIHDKIVPFSRGQETNKLIKNSQLVPFQFSGHGAFWEERDRFNQLLVQFIG